MNWTDYEWNLEETDKWGDVIDNNFSDQLPVLPTDPNVSLVLVKSITGPGGGKAWAYVRNGKLPEQFDNGDKVPQRFHAELAKEAK